MVCFQTICRNHFCKPHLHMCHFDGDTAVSLKHSKQSVLESAVENAATNFTLQKCPKKACPACAALPSFQMLDKLSTCRAPEIRFLTLLATYIPCAEARMT